MASKNDKKDDINTINTGEFETPVNDLLEESLFLPDAGNYEEDNSINTEAIKKYKEYIKSQQLFKVDVVRTDAKGDLYMRLSGNLTGCIKNIDVHGAPFDAKKRNLHVGVTYAVIATDIDEDKGIVYLSRHKAKQRAKEVLLSTLKPGMKVNARVQFYQAINKRVYINIEGCGILGFVHISDWSHKFIEDKDIESVVKPGEVVKVKILEYKPQKDKIKEAFQCSRKSCVNNPWDGLENILKKNDIIEVTAAHLHEDHFYGPLQDMDLDIYVEYPCMNNSEEEEQKACDTSEGYADAQKHKTRIIIKKEHKYQVRIYKINAERKILRGRVIKEVLER